LDIDHLEHGSSSLGKEVEDVHQQLLITSMLESRPFRAQTGRVVAK
jgi:hypothetical protein